MFLATELLAGEDLEAAIARAPAGLDPAWSTDVLLAACAGVSAGHGCGVAHHNLKPESILLCGPATEDPSPKVLDFGVASLLATRSHGLTSAGSGRATVFFLSPEQVRGEAADGRSDQYALAVILYQCLTGRVPHQGDSSFAIMSSISSGHFQPPRELRPDLPPALEAVLMRAMASQPVERFATVHELGRALLGFASSPAQARWSSHFLGAPAPAVPLLTRQPVEPKPRPLETSIFPAINQGPAPTLIGYRLAADAPPEMTERLPRPRKILGDLMDDYEFHYPQELSRGQPRRGARGARRARHLHRSARRRDLNPRFGKGGLSSPDDGIRAEALDEALRAADFAASVGAQMVLWPGVEGCVCPFQTAYAESWAAVHRRRAGEVAERCDSGTGSSSSSSTRTPSPR